jgi:AcrR family transcriptional regulator
MMIMGKVGVKKDRRTEAMWTTSTSILSEMLRLSTFWPIFFCVPPSRRPYHHGNLRQVLLDAGVALIRKVGPKSFTMREVARRAGVSHNAPYRHFRDKDELVSAIAGQGFERLNDAMIGQAATGKTGIERLELCGRAYVNFALRWPGHFTAMFDLAPQPGAGRLPADHSVSAGDLAFQTLVGFIVQCQNEKVFPQGDPLPFALMAWSIVHGIAKLSVSGHLSPRKEDVLYFTGKATAALIRGLKTS